MTPFCMRLGGGSQETVALELLLSFTTVTAWGGALGTVRGGGTALMLFHQHPYSEHNELNNY